jgi:hypothetical protein
MMFMVVFGSLAAAMAVVAQGNLRTADSALKVSRAHSAAETGLIFAARRLGDEGRRFVITKGEVSGPYAEDLWMGTYGAGDGDVIVLAADGYDGDPTVTSLSGAILDAHSNTWLPDPVPQGEVTEPQIDAYGTVRVPPVPLTPDAWEGPFFRLKYELLADEPYLRVTSQGVDGDITRTLQMDFLLEKKIEFAVISPNRIMIGKNVRVEGPLGSRYGIGTGELEGPNADPLVMRSDFYYLDDDLNASLDLLGQQVVTYDVDGDGRLRPEHPNESDGLAGMPTLIDYDGDEYVDDFDLFLAFFDGDGDKRVVYNSALAGGLAEEFAGIDDQLARLIDEARPDRDGDGTVTAADTALGYKDGMLSRSDRYAKVNGNLAFAVARAPWDEANGASYQTVVQGPIRPEGLDTAPIGFEVGQEELLEITTAMLDSSAAWHYDEAQTGASFGTYNAGTGLWNGQVGAQISAGGEYEAPGPDTWESVPHGSKGAYDYYQRPVFRNMTFTNVRIPKGTNALFEDCTFIGVTFLETNEDCGHFNWNYAGALEQSAPGVYTLKFPDLTAMYGGSTVVADTRTESNNIRFQGCTFLGAVSGHKPGEYTHWRNKVQFTGTTRFYIDPNDPDLADQDDADELKTILQTMDASDREELAKSSILLPGWSVDVGNFDNEQAADPEDTPKVKLSGTIVAGILDARGTVDIHGTLMMTFRPVEGEGPLYYGGQPDAFNTTIGYFGPDDGDGEGISPTDPDFPGFGEITLRYDPTAKLPDGIPWPIRVDAAAVTYVEGGSL